MSIPTGSDHSLELTMRWMLVALATLIPLSIYSAPPDFDAVVAPLLASQCLDCHAGPEPKGKLDLSRNATASKVIVAGKPAESELWQRVSQNEMPPKKPLSDNEKQLLKSWIEAGAKWGTDPIDPFARSSDKRAGRDWWALQPLANRVEGRSIDSLLAESLAKKQLTRNKPADARSLLRRVSFDLVGLPPSPEEMAAFETDPSEAVYGKIVDRLLASPQYGERWARHWLDLVRYGESDGFERNEPRSNAWHYRDWVIQALNSDMPFDRFAKLQIAGDVLELNNPDAVKATGFLVAGIHNTVLGVSPIARETSRQDELEEIIAAVGQSFLGLTVQCARCHDHKFDPISQADYYRLAASLGGVHHGERTISSAEQERKKASLQSRHREIEEAVGKLEAAVRLRIAKDRTALNVAPIGRWSFEGDAKDSVGALHGTLKNGAKIERGRLVLDGKGAHAIAVPLTRSIREKTLEAWVQLPSLDQGGGGVITLQTTTGSHFDSIVFAERQPFKWMAGSNGYTRTRAVNGDAEKLTDVSIHVAITYSANGQIALYRNGQKYGEPYTPGELLTYKANESQLLFGQRHTGGGKPFLHGEIEEARLYDRALTPDEVAQSAKNGPNAASISETELLAAMTGEAKQQREKLLDGRKQFAAELKSIPPPVNVFAVTPKAVPKTHVLARGSVEKRREEVVPAGLAVLADSQFGLTSQAQESARRLKLAEWIARKENPLFARVIVNRIWQHHFGIGIVETASDFGFNGGRPTNPALLDHLASSLIERNWSLKQLHKQILTSATYRQSSTGNALAIGVDADNRLLWRKSPTRLEAETLRDAILYTSGQMNNAVGGPPFHDVRTYANNGTTYYEPIDPFGKEFDRRTIYRFSPRGERSALLETFDCPDPSSLTPRRQVTTTPLQALALWNNSFVLRMSEQFAARVESDNEKGGTTTAKIARAYRLALGRGPTDEESKLAAILVEKHGLKALGRVLFNSNEFVVIE